MLINQMSPWKDMKRILVNKITGEKVRDFLADDSETKNWGATEWINSNYDVLVEIPKFYYLTTITPGLVQPYISTQPLPNYKIHPAFERADEIKNYAYASAFEGYIDAAGLLRSIPYVQPTTNKTIAEFRTAAKAGGRAAGFQLENMYLRAAIQLLFLIEYGNLNSQAVLSPGITNLNSGTVNHSQNTGKTLSLNNSSGQIVQTVLENGATFQTGNTETYPFSYRGIENLWGNIWKFTDGFMKTADGIYFDYENNETTPSAMKEFYPRADVNAYTYGYIKETDKRIGWGLIPEYSFNGSSSTYLCDHLWVNTGARITRWGAAWSHNVMGGLFALDIRADASTPTQDCGARVAFWN